MNLHTLTRKLILKTPAKIHGPLLRNMIEFPHEVPSELRFKVAETQDELEQAFRLLHDAYVKEGLMTPHPSGMRVTKYHALPSTSTLIALQGTLVVGTVSLVRRSSFGLPMETIFSLDELPLGARIAEVSSLAIRKEFQQQRGRILFPLLKFLKHYSMQYFGVSHFVMAANPKWKSFYECILLFKTLDQKKVEHYDFVNGAPAIGGILDLNFLARNYHQVYGHKPIRKDLSHFFIDLECKNMEFPMRKKGLISDPVLSPRLMKYFFIEHTNALEEMTDFERMTLREMYNRDEYLALIPKPNCEDLRNRKEKRFETRLHGRIQLPEGRSIPVEIQNVSEKGIGGTLSAPIPEGLHQLHIDIEDHHGCTLEGEILWRDSKGHFGLMLKEPTDMWKKFVRYLDYRLIAPSAFRKRYQTIGA